MTLNQVARWLSLGLVAAAAWIGLSAPAEAVPVFARQTGHNCQACHTSPPELTAYGREFKLNGYTFGEAQLIPLAWGVMASAEYPRDNTDHSSGQKICAACGEFHIDQASLYFGGKIAENLGVFGQYTVAPNGGGTGPWSGAEDNTEIRYVHRLSSTGSGEDDTVVGLDINNNMTMQDVWNNVPAWQFPGWFANSQAGFGPVASPFIDGGGMPGGTAGQRAIGIGAYVWWKKTIYAELTEYQKPWGSFSWLVNGSGNNQCPGSAQVVAGCAPSDVEDGRNWYYRLAYSHDWDYNSFEIGLFGITARTYWDAAFNTPLSVEQSLGFNTVGNATNTYRDIALDTQFQYNRNEPWIYTIGASYIHETASLTPLAQNGFASNNADTMREFKIRGTTYYDRTYGVSLSYVNLSGSGDPLRYGSGGSGGSLTGSPNSSYFDIELDYVPLQNMKFLLHYTAYTKLNGGGGNFDGFGNNASGQNLLIAGIWWDY
jgi:hypothetical protein